jgi:three-Cys-motif partner protein
MSRRSSITWPIEKHTIVKHKILEYYLSAWFPIISSWNKQVLYIDGFAGPGKYSKNEEGSPIIAINTALKQPSLNKSEEIIFLFIEKDPRRLQSLKVVVDEKFQNLPTNYKIHFEGGQFQPILSSILDGIQDSETLIPAFVFIDPFGYSGFSMKTIHHIFRFKTTEIFVTFMSGFLKRFISKPEYKIIFNNLFGDNGWEKANELNGKDKEAFLVNYYCSKLKEKAKYVKHFEMRDKDYKLIYHLVFGTKHLSGLKAMKESMFKVDKLQEYKFADSTNPEQSYIIDYFGEELWIQHAGTELLKKFSGKIMDVEKIEEYVIESTPYVFRKKILSKLEKDSKIEVYKRNKKYSYPDGCKIKFL